VTAAHVVVIAVGVGILFLPALIGVRCLTKARQLLRWRRPSLKGLDGQRAALRGQVRMSDPVKDRTPGDCLWSRELVRRHIVGYKSSSMETVSDLARKAKFSIVIDGLECVIADLPTQVYGALATRARNADRSVYTYWLPVVDYLTVLGWVRQKGSRWEIVQDPKVGLIYSRHPAESTALREIVKGGLLLALVGAGVWAFYLILESIR